MYPKYDPKQDHSYGLTVEICLEKLEQIDSALPDVTHPGKIARIMESREWFAKQLAKLQKAPV